MSQSYNNYNKHELLGFTAEAAEATTFLATKKDVELNFL